MNAENLATGASARIAATSSVVDDAESNLHDYDDGGEEDDDDYIGNDDDANVFIDTANNNPHSWSGQQQRQQQRRLYSSTATLTGSSGGVFEVTQEDYESRGADMQGIDWNTVAAVTQLDPDRFRQLRRAHYRDVENCRSISQQQQQQPMIVFDDYNLIPVHDLQHSSVEEAVGSSQLVESRRRLQLLQPQLYYRFRYTRLAERCSILHAQLRNLLCSSSKHDIFYATQSHIIRQWNPITRQGRQLIDFSRLPGSSPTVFRVSALCARYDVLVVAGYFGEVACKLLETAAEEPPQFSIASCADNSLINYADICYTRSGTLETVVSCNDGNVRYLDVPSLQQTVCFNFDWPVNCAEQSPDSQLVAVVGDAVETVLIDSASGAVVERLAGHRDYGFAVRWSPDGRHLATASQDRTVQIYDCRNRSRPLCVLKTCLASVRSLRYTSDSKLLLMAESADFIHIVNVESGYSRWQSIDLLGEIGGICLTPGDESLFIACGDEIHGGLMEFERKQ